MNLWINPVDIARRPLRSIGLALEHIDPVPAFRHMRTMKRETKFQRHIEAGNPLRGLDPRQVMNREIGLVDQTDDGFEPALVRNGERRIDAQAKLGQAYDVSQIKVFKLFIVWDVEEHGLDALAPWHT